MNFKERKHIFILAFIIFIAIFLRFYQLGENPPSLTWDEAAWGYNAYSLGIDGRDEFGRFLPLDYLESFGDFKPPMYAYLSILPVKIFGLTEFSTRFTSAFFGVVTVLVTYFLTKRIFFLQYSPLRELRSFATARGNAASASSPALDRRGSPNGLPRGDSRSELVALLSSFFLAISPWHINLSRAAFEANVATFFIVIGVYLFLVSTTRGVATNTPRRWNCIYTSGIALGFSFISFVLSIYTFNTARIVSPILVIVLSLIFWRRLWKIKYQLAVAIVIGIVLMLPIARFLVTPQASLRFKEVNIFWDLEVLERTNQEIENDKSVWWSKIMHNRRLAFGAEYLKHYFDHFNPSFLFIKGDGNPKFSTQDVGQMYLWELPFFIMGFLLLFRQRLGYWWLIPLWMLIGIVPAATARETPHALRIETAIPTFQIITAVGVVALISKISNIPPSLKLWRASKYFKFLIVIFIFSLFTFNFVYYLHGYYTHYPREYSGEWQYGYKESIEYVKSVQDQYDQIRITSSMGRPYIYYAFFTKTDPEIFRKTAIVERDGFGFVTVSGFLKYRFADSLGSIKGETRKVLYVDTPGRVHPKGDVLKKFYLLNGAEALVAYRL